MFDASDPETQKAFDRLAKAFAVISVRNIYLEELHSGIVPTSNAGDGSDIRVIDADGNEIAWNELSRFNDDEMKKLMKQVVDRLYTCLLHMLNPDFAPTVSHAHACTLHWDDANEVEGLKP